MAKKRIKLNLWERFTLPTVYPKRGSYADHVVVRDLNRKLEITQDEVDKHSITQLPDGSFTWSNAGSSEKEFEFTDFEIRTIRNNIQQANSANNLPIGEREMRLWTKFIDEQDLKESVQHLLESESESDEQKKATTKTKRTKKEPVESDK